MSASTHRVPKHLVTGPNCIVIPNDWDYSYGTPETTFVADDLLIVDKDKCPRHGEIVVMCREEGGKPFGGQCHLQPLEGQPRELWTMGVQDGKGDIHFFRLGDYAWFGVVTGKVPVGQRRDDQGDQEPSANLPKVSQEQAQRRGAGVEA